MVWGSGTFPCKKHAPYPIKVLGIVLGTHGAEVLQGLFLPHFARVESDMHAILLEPTYLMSVGGVCVKKTVPVRSLSALTTPCPTKLLKTLFCGS